VAKGLLSTHVLDTEQGSPARGVRVELFRIDASGASERVAKAVTNADGRTDAALLSGDTMREGTYELVFHLGDYFHARQREAGQAFFDKVPVRFVIRDLDYHYHVPVVASPWAYCTYRGNPHSKVS
jgi:5-hydroxyisourate hydrolase